MSVQISAIICTHNRAEYMRKALRSLVDQTLPKELYEIIVVDNASKDNTKEVVDEFSEVPNLRYIYEPALGLSRARNTGWQNARGAYIALLDDDAVASPEWLEKYLEVFETFEPRPGAVGGKVAPIWEAPKPDWLSEGMLGRLSIYQPDVPAILSEQHELSACSIAYPKDLLRAVGGFREDLGRRGTKLLAGEETYLHQQLKSQGYCLVCHPDIVAGHHISAARLTKRWFREHSYWTGVSRAVMASQGQLPPHAVRAWLLLSRIGWALPRLVLMLLENNSSARFRRQCQIIEAAGYVAALWKLDKHLLVPKA